MELPKNYDYEQAEQEALAFILDELDLTLPHTHRHRAKFDRIHEKFHRLAGNIPDIDKKRLMRIYEAATDVAWSEHDQ